MATVEAMAIRANAALDRIEAALSAMKGEELEPMQRLFRDRELLRVQQLEQIANWIEEIATEAPKKDVEAMFVASMEKQAVPIRGKARK